MPLLQSRHFDFLLPSDLIAQFPVPKRDQSRLLVLNRATQSTTHQPNFCDILGYFRPGDLLILNNSRVIPARLRGHKAPTGGDIEVLLLEEISKNDWWALLRPGKRVRPGTNLRFPARQSTTILSAVVLDKNVEGHCRLQFTGAEDVASVLREIGEVPLPPYISRSPEPRDQDRYQTVYARVAGSVAAPTAGLHFTEPLLDKIRELGVQIAQVTLHVGLGTFAPVKTSNISSHKMHEERFELAPAAAEAINSAREERRRIIAVGTTTVRVLESIAAMHEGRVAPISGRTQIFIYPPFQFRVVDALVTNFHLPRSTLLMLVSAFAAPGGTQGRDVILAAYAEAVREEYRFFSYGDAMLIV